MPVSDFPTSPSKVLFSTATHALFFHPTRLYELETRVSTLSSKPRSGIKHNYRAILLLAKFSLLAPNLSYDVLRNQLHQTPTTSNGLMVYNEADLACIRTFVRDFEADKVSQADKDVAGLIDFEACPAVGILNKGSTYSTMLALRQLSLHVRDKLGQNSVFHLDLIEKMLRFWFNDSHEFQLLSSKRITDIKLFLDFAPNIVSEQDLIKVYLTNIATNMDHANFSGVTRTATHSVIILVTDSLHNAPGDLTNVFTYLSDTVSTQLESPPLPDQDAVFATAVVLTSAQAWRGQPNTSPSHHKSWDKRGNSRGNEGQGRGNGGRGGARSQNATPATQSPATSGPSFGQGGRGG